MMISLQEHIRQSIRRLLMRLDGQQMHLRLGSLRQQNGPLQLSLGQLIPDGQNDDPRAIVDGTRLYRQPRAPRDLCYPVRQNIPEEGPPPSVMLLTDDDQIGR